MITIPFESVYLLLSHEKVALKEEHHRDIESTCTGGVFSIDIQAVLPEKLPRYLSPLDSSIA